jgi:hypothetical protein
MQTAAGQNYADKVFDKYLRHYAEPEAQHFATTRFDYARALIVPVTRESIGFLDGYRHAAQQIGGRTLCIVVINGPPTAAQPHLQQNLQLREQLLGAKATPLANAPPLWWVEGPDFDLLVVDRFSARWSVPEQCGVGLARKLGTDIATMLFRSKQLRSPWLYVTDADATLPAAYFNYEPAADSVALSFPFWHFQGSDEDVFNATLRYEIALRYQVLGAHWAGNPYAWHAVGSSLAVHAASYCAVRGFPKRAAGEDFYLLQKVAKLGPIEVPTLLPIQLEARLSDRVPYGTGPAASALLNAAFELDSSESFAQLRCWLTWLNTPGALQRGSEDFLASVTPDLLPLWQRFVQELGFDGFLAKTLAGSSDPEQQRRRAFNWFDGLRCQQLLHRLRHEVYPRVEAAAALARAEFVSARAKHLAATQDLLGLRAELFDQEGNLPRWRGPVQRPR